MKEIATFGERLGVLMKRHELTNGALARRLRLSSSVPISRVLKDQTSAARRTELLELIRADGAIFSPDELSELEDALSVNRVGKNPYKAQSSFFKLLFSRQNDAEDIQLSGMNQTFEEYLTRFSPREPLRLILINSCETALPHMLSSLLSDRNRLIELHHYTAINDATRNPALLLRFSSHFLNNPRYHPYVLTERDNDTDAFFFAPNVMLIRYGAGPSALESIALIRSDHSADLLSGLERYNLFNTIFRAINSIATEPKPLWGWPEGQPVARLLPFYREMYAPSARRAIWQLKNAPGFDLTPPETLIQIFRSSPGYANGMGTLSASGDLEFFFNLRYKRFTTSSAPVHVTFSPAGIRAFLQTGRLSNHPDRLRAYTVDERAQLLETLIDLDQSCKNFHFHLLNDKLMVRRFHITCFEGRSMLFSGCEPGRASAHPFYSREPLLVNQFVDFYRYELLTRHVQADASTRLKQMRSCLPSSKQGGETT